MKYAHRGGIFKAANCGVSGHSTWPSLSGNQATIVVSGELDVHSAPRLRQSIHQALRSQVGMVVLDLTGVSFIDVRGLELLVEMARETRDRGAGFALRHPSEIVLRVRDMVGLDERILHIES